MFESFLDPPLAGNSFNVFFVYHWFFIPQVFNKTFIIFTF